VLAGPEPVIVLLAVCMRGVQGTGADGDRRRPQIETSATSPAVMVAFPNVAENGVVPPITPVALT